MRGKGRNDSKGKEGMRCGNDGKGREGMGKTYRGKERKGEEGE